MAKKKKSKIVPFGKYYYQGELTKKQMKMICEMIEEGITVYHQFGKPSGCGAGGCH